jgi:hypothetical protein
MEEPHVAIFFDPIETHCPICSQPVRKVTETNRDHVDSVCGNEFYAHIGDRLIKIMNPVGAWEKSKEYLVTAKV